MIAITGGGTGGHLRIAQLVKEELNRQGIRPLFIGSTGGQDREWFEGDEGFCDTLFLDSAGVMNKGVIGKFFQLSKILLLALKLRKSFMRYGVTKVFSVGGYSASPGVFAPILLKKRLYIHEQNAKIGALNRLSRPFCRYFFSSFDSLSPCKNYPVDNRFYTSRRLREKTKQILFMGGSLGARAINNLAMASAEEILHMGISIVHLTGERDFKRVSSFYEGKGLNVAVAAFDKTIDRKMAESDFAVSRAGASSLFELYANALPTLFIPYPHAASDHQFSNASMLAETGMAYCKREEELTKEYLLELLGEDHSEVSAKLYNTFDDDGIRCIVAHLLEDLA